MSNDYHRPASLIIGAGSAIGSAVIRRLRLEEPDTDILAVCRRPRDLPHTPDASLHSFACDYSESGIVQLVQQLAPWHGRLNLVVISTGILHTESIKPEKRAEDLHMDSMLEVLRINTVMPALWLSTLLAAVCGNTPCRMFTLSARVGSIADNHKGGWYSYRASKAALNMIIKTAAIEYARRAPNVKLVAFHPGTVDTGLSKPFQRNVPQDKLFSPDFVAERLLTISSDLPVDGHASYLDWAGKSITW